MRAERRRVGARGVSRACAPVRPQIFLMILVNNPAVRKPSKAAVPSSPWPAAATKSASTERPGSSTRSNSRPPWLRPTGAPDHPGGRWRGRGLLRRPSAGGNAEPLLSLPPALSRRSVGTSWTAVAGDSLIQGRPPGVGLHHSIQDGEKEEVVAAPPMVAEEDGARIFGQRLHLRAFGPVLRR